MRIETSRFGPLEIDESEILTFVQPIIGFPDQRRFAIVEDSPGSSVRWLQSLDEPGLAFMIIDPLELLPDYRPRLRPSHLQDIGAVSAEEVRLFTLVTVCADTRTVRTNLRAPIVCSPRTGLAKQLVLENSNYPIRFVLRTPARQQEEVRNVGTDS